MEARKIVIEISGGLGNQLFQLAAAKNLDVQGHDVTIDSIYNDISSFRVTEINEFANALRIPVIKRSLFLANILKIPIVKRIYISKLREKTIYEKTNFNEPILPGGSHDFRLFGYWQTITLANQIRNNLTSYLKAPAINEVAIHVRRGDYLSNHHSLHGALHGDYYLKGLATLTHKTDSKNIVIFTDNPEIVREEEWFKSLDRNKVRLSNSTQPWETLLEMSRYSSIVCSNSTFSWWAAFIGENKRIILPSMWFRNTELPSALRLPNSFVVESSFIEMS